MITPPRSVTRLCGLLGLFGTLSTFAQTGTKVLEKPPLPKGALVQPLGPKETWTISLEYGEGAEGGKPDLTADGQPQAKPLAFSAETSPKQVKIISFKPAYNLHIQGPNSRDSLHYYVYGDLVFFESPSQQPPTRMVFDGGEGGDDAPISEQILFATKDGKFFGFEWIRPEHYIGVEEVSGVQCLVFEKDGTKAWVNVEKRQPVRWQRGGEIRLFVQNSEPASHGLPETVLKRIQGMLRDLEALKKPPVRGG